MKFEALSEVMLPFFGIRLIRPVSIPPFLEMTFLVFYCFFDVTQTPKLLLNCVDIIGVQDLCIFLK